MLVALDLEQPVHIDRADPANAAEVVAQQVDDHHVLGPLLDAGAQLLSQPLVLAAVGGTRAGPLDRPCLDRPLARDPQKALRARSSGRPARRSAGGRVGSGVDRPLAQVDGERIAGRAWSRAGWSGRARRIAGDGVRAGRPDRGQVLRSGRARTKQVGVEGGRRGDGPRRRSRNRLEVRAGAPRPRREPSWPEGSGPAMQIAKARPVRCVEGPPRREGNIRQASGVSALTHRDPRSALIP